MKSILIALTVGLLLAAPTAVAGNEPAPQPLDCLEHPLDRPVQCITPECWYYPDTGEIRCWWN